jgi:hypothetical protein
MDGKSDDSELHVDDADADDAITKDEASGTVSQTGIEAGKSGASHCNRVIAAGLKPALIK